MYMPLIVLPQQCASDTLDQSAWHRMARRSLCFRAWLRGTMASLISSLGHLLTMPPKFFSLLLPFLFIRHAAPQDISGVSGSIISSGSHSASSLSGTMTISNSLDHSNTTTSSGSTSHSKSLIAITGAPIASKSGTSTSSGPPELPILSSATTTLNFETKS
ncbi:hypothetical protein BCR34DRAFT_180352 [Clohesyomyces aquaticus]|uniref:Uncharacterized protein n=1 Tax=Clohesyomyces aquaticus TaxID=1231657 RepID=A0A1Y1YES4_9PLEO|nr:hypothetical protein BCR34DRAFT_180352 [Clohesyomyces aquaticus]